MKDDKEKPKQPDRGGEAPQPPRFDLPELSLPGGLDFGRGLMSALDDPYRVDTSTSPMGRLRMLMQQLAPEIQRNVVPMYAAFERWQANPKRARVEWLLPVYVQKGWLEVGQADELRRLPDDEAYDALLGICGEKAQLRPKEKGPARISITMTMRSGGMTLKELLNNYGVQGNKLYIRQIDNDDTFVSRAVMTGNDRDDLVQQRNNHHGGRDGEELALIRSGIRASQATYVSPLSENMKLSTLAGQKYLVYTGDALDGVGPQGYPESNGFSAFHFREEGIMQRSLVAVIDNR